MSDSETALRRAGAREIFRRDVLSGLRRPQKSIPSKYFYDERGSRLFEEICGLDEYYLTRTEVDILRDHLPEIARRLGPGVRLIEPGAGSGVKTDLVLEHLKDPAAVVPIDVSESALDAAVERLRDRWPLLEVLPVVADFMEPFVLPRGSSLARRDVVFFPGSTIGNFLRDDARRFLRSMVRSAGPGSSLLVGVDLRKDPAILERAYNDSRGVTAEFNLNVLRRINRELGGNFRAEAFRHLALYDAARGRIEMRLVSDSRQRVRIAEETFELAPGESILTEYSHKYSPEGFRDLCDDAGLEVARGWSDRRGWFAVYLCAEKADGP